MEPELEVPKNKINWIPTHCGVAYMRVSARLLEVMWWECVVHSCASLTVSLSHWLDLSSFFKVTASNAMSYGRAGFLHILASISIYIYTFTMLISCIAANKATVLWKAGWSPSNVATGNAILLRIFSHLNLGIHSAFKD